VRDALAGSPVPGDGDQPPQTGGRGSRRVRLALAGIALLFIGTSPLWAPLFLRRLDFFHMHRVEVLGARYVAPGDILRLLAVDTTASIWDPMAPMEDRIAAHPQVRSVTVRRQLPGTLLVTVQEHLPVALVPGEQGFRAYDARGVPLPIDLSRVVVDAPIVARRDTAILRLLGAIQDSLPGLYQRIQEVAPAPGDQLVLRTAPVPIRVMRDVTLDRLAYIAPVEDDLARRAVRAFEIDLRFRDQVIARLQ
jgi:cell division protein FtsQ